MGGFGSPPIFAEELIKFRIDIGLGLGSDN